MIWFDFPRSFWLNLQKIKEGFGPLFLCQNFGGALTLTARRVFLFVSSAQFLT
jgi:hypothetical protein